MITTTHSRLLLAALALTGCLLVAACTSSKTAISNTAPASTSTNSSKVSSGSTSSTMAGATTITIKNFAYTVSGTVASGAMVMVTDNDSETHTVTADTGNAFTGTVEAGKTAMFAAPTMAGTYKFHCNFHSNMHGSLVVTE